VHINRNNFVYTVSNGTGMDSPARTVSWPMAIVVGVWPRRPAFSQNAGKKASETPIRKKHNAHTRGYTVHSLLGIISSNSTKVKIITITKMSLNKDIYIFPISTSQVI